MENNDKPKIIGKIDLSIFNKKTPNNLKIRLLQNEFNAEWKCILQFLKENNFDIVFNSKYILTTEEYDFLKLNFKNNYCSTKVIKNLDIEAELARTTVSNILDYIFMANIKYQLSDNKNEIIGLDYKTWYTIREIIDSINTIPISEILEYKKEHIDIMFKDVKKEMLDYLEINSSNYKNDNSIGKGLYNISLGDSYTKKWSCNLCDGDYETGCLLSDQSRCIK